MPELHALVEKHSDAIIFSLIYIAEAHATDEWPIGELPAGLTELRQHVSIEDRRQAAAQLLEEYKDVIHPRMDIKLDELTNEFNRCYSSWPFRVWIVDNGKIVFKGLPTEDGDNLDYASLRRYIENNPMPPIYLSPSALRDASKQDTSI